MNIHNYNINVNTKYNLCEKILVDIINYALIIKFLSQMVVLIIVKCHYAESSKSFKYLTVLGWK